MHAIYRQANICKLNCKSNYTKFKVKLKLVRLIKTKMQRINREIFYFVHFLVSDVMC